MTYRCCSSFSNSSRSKIFNNILDKSELIARGFSLVELTVTGLLLALLLVATASLFTSSTQATRKGTKYNKISSIIDKDLTEMKRLAENFTCCAITAAGSGCSVNSVCANPLPNSSYYFPEVNSYSPLSAADQQKIDAFTSKCQSGLELPLISEMAQNAPGGILDTVDSVRVLKVVVKDKANDASDHVIRISYSAPGIQRTSLIVPTISAWCP